jgi:anti-anti-sigma factor
VRYLNLRRSPSARAREPGSGAVTVALTGTLDGTTSASVDGTLRQASATAGIVILDLRALWTMDLQGAVPIVQADLRIRAAGGRLIVVQGGPYVQRCFARAGLDELLEIIDQPPSLADFRAGRFDPSPPLPGLADEVAPSQPRRIPRVLAAFAAAFRRPAPDPAPERH